LRRWEELRSEFDERGVQVLTISTDHPEEIRMGRRVHGLQATMLSDRTLAVTDAFGLRNQGAHSGMPRDEIEALPIPASVLVDADGKVLWLDVSDNYQRRSGPEVVLAAVEKYLD
jgi:peroxiredoxin